MEKLCISQQIGIIHVKTGTVSSLTVQAARAAIHLICNVSFFASEWPLNYSTVFLDEENKRGVGASQI